VPPAASDAPNPTDVPFQRAYPGDLTHVHYSNSATGTESDYFLDVEFDGNEVDTIHFPSGGFIGPEHIISQDDNGDGTITVHIDTGAEYIVDGPSATKTPDTETVNGNEVEEQ